MKKKVRVTKSNGNVFADIGLPWSEFTNTGSYSYSFSSQPGANGIFVPPPPSWTILLR